MRPDAEKLEILRDRYGALPFTEDQRTALLEDGELLVSAAAGSGKTSTLVNRIILRVACGASLKDMLVLVYNDAAASELKKRLHEKLFEKACTTRGELGDIFRAELDDLPFCHIGTIHSFCQSLIRDNFEKLEVSPTFEVMDEAKHDVYKNAAIALLMERKAQDNDSVFDDLAEVFSRGRSEDHLKEKIIKLHEVIDIQPDRDAFMDKVKRCFDSYDDSYYLEVLYDGNKSVLDGISASLKDFAAQLEEHARLSDALGLVDKEVDMALNFRNAAMDVAYQCDRTGACADFAAMAQSAAAYEIPSLGKRPAKKLLSDRGLQLTDFVLAQLKAAKECMEKLARYHFEKERFRDMHAQNAVYVHKLVEITLEYDQILENLKKADGVMSFEDLLKGAAKLLSQYPELGGKFKEVYVDEYQDVNPTQEFIIEKLLRGECFMVGDVKQSIYGFRLADPTIFLSRQARYAEGKGGLAINFNSNFRSQPGILKFVNEVFDAVMTPASADVDYKGTARFTIPEDTSNGCVHVRLFKGMKAENEAPSGLYDITADEQSDDDINASDSEGRFIAEEIKNLVGHMLVTDDNVARAARYDDIVVLFRNRSGGAARIIDVLKRAGIPISEGSFVDDSAVAARDILNFLRVIDNGRQDIPLAGFLLSPFGGFDEEELASVASYDAECLYDKVRYAAALSLSGADKGSEAEAVDAKCARVLEMLDVYRTKASFKSVADLMSGIVSDFSYDAILMQSGESNVHALRNFIASAAAFDESLGKFLEEYAAGKEQPSSAASGNRVRVSTFHGFKGLEAPIVFVADVAKPFNTKSFKDDLIFDGGGYIGIKYFDFKNKYKFGTLSIDAATELMQLKQVKEEMRLFYVALTRAKQAMYVTAAVSNAASERFGKVMKGSGAKSDLDFISDAVYAGSLTTRVEIVEPVAEEHIAVAKSLKGDPAVLKAINEARKKFDYPYKTSTQLPMKCSVSALIDNEESVRVYDERAALGTLYHKVMQNIDFFKNTEDGVKEELARMVEEQIVSNEDASKIDEGAILRCLCGEIGELARDAMLHGRCFREQSFLMYKAANEVSDNFSSDDKVLVQGVVDLFIDGKQRMIVDFKNSYLRDDEVIQKYKKQLYLYRSAIESAIGAKIDRVALYSFKTGAVIDL